MIYVLAIVIQSDTTGSNGTSSGTDLVSLFLQYGIPGLVIAALLLGWLWAKPSVERLILDKQRAEDQRDELLKVYEEKILPALNDSIVITRDLKPVMQDVVNTLTLVKDQISQQGRSGGRRT